MGFILGQFCSLTLALIFWQECYSSVYVLALIRCDGIILFFVASVTGLSVCMLSVIMVKKRHQTAICVKHFSLPAVCEHRYG